MFAVEVYLLLATILFHLLMGIIVIANNPYSAINRLMVSLSVNVILWSFSVLMITINTDYNALLFWIRASHAFVIFLPWHVYAIATSFLWTNPFSDKKTIVFLIASLFFSVISFTPLVIEGVGEPLLMKELQPGPLFIYFSLFLIGVLVNSIILLSRKLIDSRGLIRIQMKYLIWGIISFIILSTLVNLFLPLMGIWELGSFDLRPLGPVFSLVLVGSISYAIVKYRFMDIRFAFRRNVALFISAIILIAVLIMLFRFFGEFKTILPGVNLELVVILAVLAVIFVLPPLRDRIQVLLDSYLFKKVTDYHSSLLKQVRDLFTVLDLEELMESINRSIVHEMDLEFGIYGCKINGEYYFSDKLKGSSVGKSFGRNVITPDSSLVLYAEEYKDMFLQTDFKRIKPGLLREPLEREMKELGIEAAVPLLSEDKVEGILFLGAKLSGEPFFKEDVQLLSIIASQITVAMKNARLYQDLLLVKQNLEKIVANMGNGLVAVNENEEITIFNSEAETITGISADRALGCKALPVLGNSLYEIYRQTIEDDFGKEEEVKLQLEAKERFIKCNTSMLESRDIDHCEVIMVLSDLTRVKELENEKSQSQRLASLGEIAAGIAHEIKNPLVSIKTFADLLPVNYDDQEFRYSFSQVVSQEITRINDLVGELLNFTKGSELYYEQFELPALLDEVILLLSFQMEKQNIMVQKVYEDNMGLVKLDRGLIKQAVLNICVNAIHAMPEGGKLEIGVDPDTSPPATTRGKSKKDRSPSVKQGKEIENQVKIYVSDSGRGIPQSIRDRVFDPFFTSKTDGVGIGLSLSHKIVTAHGGQIKFSSREGKGTVFEVLLPQ